MTSRAPRAWWLETKSYASRKPRHRLASLGNPKKKKCSLLFGFARDQFFLKMERTFFFLGFCPPSIRAGGGTMRTKFWQNYFLGKGFAKTSADWFLNLDVANGKGGGWGGIFHLLLFLFWGNSGRTYCFFNLNLFSYPQILFYQSRLWRSVLSKFRVVTCLFHAYLRHDRVHIRDHFQNYLVLRRQSPRR